VSRPGQPANKTQQGIKPQQTPTSAPKKVVGLTQGKEPITLSPLIIAAIVMAVLAVLGIVGIVVFKFIGP
jgi:hypothetical protein